MSRRECLVGLCVVALSAFLPSRQAFDDSGPCRALAAVLRSLGRRLLPCASVLLAGCAVLPLDKYPNEEVGPEPDVPVGTYNASLSVPWDYDFSAVDEARAAQCRRFLATGRRRDGDERDPTADPCAGIPRDRNFVALVMSGGGSRSAALSAAIIWELHELGILKHIDVISAVSGGAQAAALYALMRNPDDAAALEPLGPRFAFGRETFVDVFEGNLAAEWFISLTLPVNLPAYLFTYYDRTDVMAHTFADAYYSRKRWHLDHTGLRYRDISANRPNLLLNSVDMSLRLDANGVPTGVAGRCFVLSYEAFHDVLGSDLHDFPVAHAVMASNAFPGVYHYLSLRNFDSANANGDDVYVHLADGGIRDHLALVPISAMLRRFAAGRPLEGLGLDELTQACEFSRGARTRLESSPETPLETAAGPDSDAPILPDKIVVIAIDAGIPSRGFPETSADPGAGLFERLFPVAKVMDAMDTTLDDQRMLRAAELVELRNYLTGKKALENHVRACLYTHRGRVEDLAACLDEGENGSPDRAKGIFGPECCPFIGLGVHNFMKYAALKFGPINLYDLDSDKPWGADLITLECMADNDFGRGRRDSLYAEIRKMGLGLSLDARKLDILKRAGKVLVREMLVDFCDADGHLGGVEEIACPIPSERYVVTCQQ